MTGSQPGGHEARRHGKTGVAFGFRSHPHANGTVQHRQGRNCFEGSAYLTTQLPRWSGTGPQNLHWGSGDAGGSDRGASKRWWFVSSGGPRRSPAQHL